jgi:chromosome segregation ATPase
MRNDARDELDHVPSLTPDRGDQDDFAALPVEPRSPAYARPQVAAGQAVSTGPLWALVGALGIALGGLGWWSFQQISLMEQQLVATQESFARISEEAAGRIQDISGKVVATESSVLSDSESLKLQVRQLEGRLAELGKQQQALVTQQGGFNSRFEQLAGEIKSQQGVTGKFDDSLKTLTSEQAALKKEQAALKVAQVDTGKLETQLKRLTADIETLKKQANSTNAIARIEQDLLVLKSDLETRAAGSSTAEFDAFRAQTSRNISTLQAQVVNLQQQIDAR